MEAPLTPSLSRREKLRVEAALTPSLSRREREARSASEASA